MLIISIDSVLQAQIRNLRACQWATWHEREVYCLPQKTSHQEYGKDVLWTLNDEHISSVHLKVDFCKTLCILKRHLCSVSPKNREVTKVAAQPRDTNIITLVHDYLHGDNSVVPCRDYAPQFSVLGDPPPHRVAASPANELGVVESALIRPVGKSSGSLML